MADFVNDKAVSMEKDAIPPSNQELMSEHLSALRLELSTLRAKVTQLESELQCAICRGPLRIPISLPCGHSFCSACARRALLSRSRCVEPHCTAKATTADLRPVRALEACVAHVFPSSSARVVSTGTKPARRRIPHLPRASRATLSTTLRSIGLRTDGSAEVLAKRHREFVLLWNANLDSATPLSENAIAEQVMSAERALAVAASRKPGRKVTNLFRKRPAPSPPDNSDLPEEGDGHEALIRKIRRREGCPVGQLRPRESNSPPNQMQGDLTLVDADDKLTESPEVQEVSIVPSSQSTWDHEVIGAADRVAQGQKVDDVPSSPRTPPRPARCENFWAHTDDSCSTIAPSPMRSSPMQQTPLRPRSTQQPTSGQPSPGTFFTTSPVRPPHVPQSPHFSGIQRSSSSSSQGITVASLAKDRQPRSVEGQQVSSAKIHIVPWRPFPNKSTQSPVSFGASTRSTPAVAGSFIIGRSGGLTSAQDRMPTQSPPSAFGNQQYRRPFSEHATTTGLNSPGASWRQTVSNRTQPMFSQSQAPSQTLNRHPLSEEQRERIEKNRQQAIQRQLAAKKRREEMLRGATR